MIGSSLFKFLVVVFTVLLLVLSLLLWREKRRELFLAYYSFFIGLVVCELAIRNFYPQFNHDFKLFQFDPKLGWRFIPDTVQAVVSPGEVHHHVRINEDGFRDSRRSIQQDSDRAIAVFGDSFVSNISTRSDRVFTEILESRLTATMPSKDLSWQVDNFGVNGYGQVQELLLLREVLAQRNYGLVVLTIYVRNDFTDNTDASWIDYARPHAYWDSDRERLVHSSKRLIPPKVSLPTRFNWRIHRHSQFYHLVYTRLTYLFSDRSDTDASRFGYRTPPELYLCQRSRAREMDPLFSVMRALLGEMKAEVEKTGAIFAVMIAPSFVQVDGKLWSDLLSRNSLDKDEYDIALPNRRLGATTDSLQIPTLDLLPIFTKASPIREYYYKQEQHWNDEGNQVVADALYTFLIENQLLSQTTP